MKLDVINNAKKGITAGLIYKIITAALPFYIRTILLKFVGIEFLGIRGLFASILQVLNLAELGFCEAIVFNMYSPIAKNDGEKIKSLLSLYRFVYFIIGCFIFIAGLILIPFLPNLIKGDYPSDINIYLVYIIILLNTSLSYLVGAYRKSLFLAHQRTDITFNVSSIIAILTGTAEILVIYLTRNIYLYLSVSVIFTIINNITWVVVSNKIYPNYKQLSKKVPFFLLKDIKKNIVGILSIKAAAVVRTSASSIFISMFLGVSMLAIYNNYFLIVSTLELFFSVIHTSLLAGLGNKIINNTVEENYKEFTNINFLYMMLTSVCTVCLFCLYQPFMMIWTGEKYLLSIISVALLSLMFYIKKIGGIESLYSEANGFYWENKERALIETLLYILLGYLFTRFFGLNGAICSVIITLFFGLVLPETKILYKRYFKTSTKSFFASQLAYFLTTILMTSVCYYICGLVPLKGIIGFVIDGILCVVVCLLIITLFFHKTEKYSYSLLIIKKIISSSIESKNDL